MLVSFQTLHISSVSMCFTLSLVWQGPDYRLYKSEPELTTVAEVDENNGEDRSEHPADREHAGSKGETVKYQIMWCHIFLFM